MKKIFALILVTTTSAFAIPKQDERQKAAFQRVVEHNTLICTVNRTSVEEGSGHRIKVVFNKMSEPAINSAYTSKTKGDEYIEDRKEYYYQSDQSINISFPAYGNLPAEVGTLGYRAFGAGKDFDRLEKRIDFTISTDQQSFVVYASTNLIQAGDVIRPILIRDKEMKDTKDGILYSIKCDDTIEANIVSSEKR